MGANRESGNQLTERFEKACTDKRRGLTKAAAGRSQLYPAVKRRVDICSIRVCNGG